VGTVNPANAGNTHELDWKPAWVMKWGSSMLQKYAVGERLSAEDLGTFLRLLPRHHAAAEKEGPGVAGVEKGVNSWSQHCLFIVRVDGSVVTVGTKWIARKGTPPSPHECFAYACRETAKPSTRAFRDSLGAWACQLCGAPTPRSAGEVDHAHPITFKSLIDGWLPHERRDSALFTAVWGEEFSERWVAEWFRRHHDSTARLRWLCKPCHKNESRRIDR